jgi:hypothetical protein
MKNTNRLLPIISFLGMFLLFPITPSPALDSNPRVQDRYSSPSTGKIMPPSSTGQETFKKQQPTTDQKFKLIFSKLAALEQTVATLQNHVTAQAQQIAQLHQIISVNSSGTVTIQAPGTLKITAGATLKMAGSTIDLNAAITGAHGMLKADTMMTKTVIAQSYTPGAGNIW